ncbi:MAG: hypothetical protein IT376_02485 [Polyangiaceae bacterium]|nr:hypothetical protein [Polyangiaceae bacterium]
MSANARRCRSFVGLSLALAARAAAAPPAPAAPPPGAPSPGGPSPAAPSPAAPSPTATAPAPHARAPNALAVLDTHAFGVDAALAVLVTREALRVAEARGWAPLPAAEARRVLGLRRAPGPLTQPEVRDLTRAAGVGHGLVLSLYPSPPGYRVVAQVAVGPYVTERALEVEPARVGEAVEELLTALLPLAPPPPAERPRASGARSGSADSPAGPPELVPWRLALRTEAAPGLGASRFYNHFLGARLDQRFAERITFGLELAYVNLRGKEGRAHNVAGLAQLEHELSLGAGWGLPLRLGLGYLPRNGPLLELAAGARVAVGDATWLAFDVGPTVWNAKDQPLASLDLGLELSFDL